MKASVVKPALNGQKESTDELPLALPSPLSMKEMRAALSDQTAWLWEGYLAPGNVTLLTSLSKSGKTTLLSVLLLKERVSRLQLLGIGLSIAGLLLVTGLNMNQTGSAPLVGNLFIFGGVLAWAVYTVQGKKLVSTFPWLVITTASISAGMLFLLPFAIGELWLQGLPHLRADGLFELLYLGAVSSALGYALWNYGLGFLDASEAAPYINLIPVVGLLLSVILLHEPLRLIQAAGGALTLFGVWLSNRGQASPPN